MKKRITKIVSLLLAATMVFSLVACGNKAAGDTTTNDTTTSTDAGADSTELTTVKTAYAPFIGGIGVYVIDEANLDEQYGIDLQINAYGDTSTLLSVMTGDVDIAFTTIQAYMVSVNALVEEGTDPAALPKIVYLHNESTGADGIVAKSDITSVADLAGKQVSAQYGNVTHYMLAKALATEGLSFDDIDLVDMSPGKGGAAFIAGNLDAATTFDPYLTQAVTETGANLLITTADLERCIYDVVVVSAKVAEEKPDWLYKTLEVIDAATAYCNDDLAGAADLTADTFECTPEEVVAMCSTVYLYTMQDNVDAMAEGGWLYDSLADIQDFYVSIGEMSPDIDFSQLVDASFLTK